MSAFAAFASGLLFAVGLAVSGMTRPSKIIGFLDVAGAWDPSLLLVMGAALPFLFAAWRIAQRRSAPFLGGIFPGPARTGIDARLVGGAALFGVGWGLSGFCPGPAIVSAASGAVPALLLLAGMSAGMLAHGLLVKEDPCG